MLGIELFTEDANAEEDSKFNGDHVSLLASFQKTLDMTFLRSILLNKKTEAENFLGVVRETIDYVEKHPIAINGIPTACAGMIHAMVCTGLTPMFTPQIATLLHSMVATRGATKPVVKKTDAAAPAGAASTVVGSPLDALAGTGEDGDAPEPPEAEAAPGPSEAEAAEMDDELTDAINKDSSPNSKKSRELAYLLALGIIALLDGGETEYNKACLVAEGTKLLFCFYQFFEHSQIRLMKARPDGTSSVPMQIRVLAGVGEELKGDIQHESIKNVIEKLHSLLKTKVQEPRYAPLQETYQFVFDKLVWRIGRESTAKRAPAKRKKPDSGAGDTAVATVGGAAARHSKKSRPSVPKDTGIEELELRANDEQQSFMTRLSDLQDQLDAANAKNKRLESHLRSVQQFADKRARTESRLLHKLPALYERHSGAVPHDDMFDFIVKQCNNPTPSPPTSDDDDS